MRNIKLEGAATESVKRILRGYTTEVDLLNIIKYQNKDLEDLSNYDAAILLLYSAAFN